MSSDLYVNVPMEAIDEPDHQLRSRIDPTRLGELADSMAAEGLHQPIGLRGPLPTGRYAIVWGHRRFLAAKLLRWPHIAGRIFDAGFDPLLASVSENLQREDLTPLEEAHAVKTMVDRGQPLELVARLFRRSESWCTTRLEMLTYPADVKAAVEARLVSLGVAAELAKIDHQEYRESLIRDAARAGATISTAQFWVQHYFSDRDRIVHNHMVVEDIVQRRQAFKLMVACDWCEQDTAYDESGSVRLCNSCLRQLLEAKEKATNGGG